MHLYFLFCLIPFQIPPFTHFPVVGLRLLPACGFSINVASDISDTILWWICALPALGCSIAKLWDTHLQLSSVNMRVYAPSTIEWEIHLIIHLFSNATRKISLYFCETISHLFYNINSVTFGKGRAKKLKSIYFKRKIQILSKIFYNTSSV